MSQIIPYTTEFLAAIGESLPELTSRQKEMWISHPSILQKLLAQLDQEPIVGLEPNPIQEWRTITVGGMSNRQLTEELRLNGVEFSETMLQHCPEILIPHTARLALVSPEDLGFTKQPKLAQYLKALKSAGLSYHAAVGPYLRLAYQEQENEKDWVLVAMEPLPDDDGKAIWFLDRYQNNLTLIHDGSQLGWNYEPGVLVCVIGQMEPISSPL